MKSLDELSAYEARALRGILFDLDDTFLSHGLLTQGAYSALWNLRDAGLKLVVVTGRPCAWGEVITRQWPIDAAVVENGNVVVMREAGGIARRDRCSVDERRSRRIRLAGLASQVRSVVPEARLSDDVEGRLSDLTWDIGERVKLPSDRIEIIAREIAAAGARSTRSSVHLHATFDAYDKATGTLDYLATLGESADAAKTSYAFVGDSTNDAACFSSFITTFGVANVADVVSQLPTAPAYISPSPMGAGFSEIAAAVIRLRQK